MPKLRVAEIQKIAGDKEPLWSTRPKEEQQLWLDANKARKDANASVKHISKKGEQIDAGYTTRAISQEVRLPVHFL